MGLRVAVANGNWSNPATWNGGVLPAAGDIVASNGFTVTIDQNVNVDSLTNAATSPISSIPLMTSETTPSGVVTYSSLYSGYQAWQAFDRNTFSYYLTANFASLPQWLAYEFSISKVITSYTISSPNTAVAFPKDWTFEAWNGSSWIILHTVTGNTNTSSYTGIFSNTTAYIKYRINITANNGNNNYTSIGEFAMYTNNDYTLASTAGGTFTLNSGVTVTCTGTNGIYGSTATTMTYSGSGTSTINSKISASNTTNISTLVFNGTGSLIVNGDVYGATAAQNSVNTTINFTSAGVLTINGNLYGYNTSSGNSNIVNVSSTGTLNIVGLINVRGTQKVGVNLGGGSTLNLTGNVLCENSVANSGVGISATSATINITGNLIMTNFGASTNQGWYCVAATSCTLNITGNITGDQTINASNIAGASLSVGGTSYLNHIGTITASRYMYAYINTSTTSINILTGPFISYSSGIQPFYLVRMHYRRTVGSYFEFRDNSTNGALPPAASAPATRLVSPDTAVDAPIPANVRFGTVYASGSQTGTMKVPVAANVRLGVAVDNTTGTAVLTAADIWDYLRANMNTSGSIGERLKNASTVDSTGTQIASTAP